MQKAHWKKVPTLAVIGLSGFLASPALLTGGNSGPPKATTGASSTAKPAGSVEPVSMRDPFQVGRTPGVAPGPASPAGPTSPAGPASPASPRPEAARPGLPAMAQGEDKVLGEMRLTGTFIDDREGLAVIDDKIYTRGDQLRGADGSLLPYVVAEVSRDRALVRRGRRDFVIGFSNAPRSGVPRAGEPSRPSPSPSPSPAVAKAGAAAVPPAGARGKGPAARGPAQAGPGDQKEMVLQLLSGLLGGSAGQGQGQAAGPGAGLGAPGGGINANSIAAGLDALMGKYDNIGRGDLGRSLDNPAGGTTP